jgi:hypothetical protein
MKANNDKKNIQGDKTPIYLTPDSTLQTPSEYEHDREQNVRKDDSISVSKDDLHDPNTDRAAGNDQEATNSED